LIKVVAVRDKSGIFFVPKSFLNYSPEYSLTILSGTVNLYKDKHFVDSNIYRVSRSKPALYVERQPAGYYDLIPSSNNHNK